MSPGSRARAEDDRFAFYVSGEYQHAPFAPPFTLLQRSVIAEVDLNPHTAGNPVFHD